MTFFGKFRNILRQTVSKQVNSRFSVSNPSIYQALRYMSYAKLSSLAVSHIAPMRQV